MQIFFYRPTYPIILQTITGNKHYFFLGLIQKSSIDNQLY